MHFPEIPRAETSNNAAAKVRTTTVKPAPISPPAVLGNRTSAPGDKIRARPDQTSRIRARNS